MPVRQTSMAATPPTTSQSVALIGILLVLAGVGGTYQFLVPMLQKDRAALQLAQKQRDAAVKDVSDLQKVHTDLGAAEQQLAITGVTPQLIAQVVPATEEMPSLYIQMESLMSDSTISQPAYQLAPPVRDAGSVKVPITVTASGTYGSLKAFLTKMETNIRPITFTSITLSQVTGTTGNASSAPLSLSATGFARAHDVSSAYAKAANATGP